MKYLICLLISFQAFGSDIAKHSKELLGYKFNKTYKPKSIVSVRKNVEKILQRRLPSKYKSQASLIQKTIVHNALKHEMDPIFILAVISGESSFNPEARGPVGEIGLMQIRPSTAKWISEEILKKPWKGDKSLLNPYENIRLGIAYFDWLRTKFNNNSSHYVAAYNLGPSQLKKALKRRVRPKDYPIHIMKRYTDFYALLD